MLNEINRWVKEHQDEILATYQKLHAHPEVSWEEKETTAFLSERLSDMGLPYETFEDITGVVGYWGNKDSGPTIGLRADIDALWQNVNGEWKANHSCGHDAHMTMVLYTVRCLKELGYQPNGLLKIIFQPAEESGNGAKALIEKDVIRDIDQLLGIHVRPIQDLNLGEATPAIYHGATTLLRGTVTGVQAHGSRPHLGINVVDSLAAIVQAINSIKLDPTISYSAKVTMMKAGGDNVNIIPDYGEFGVDLRAETNDAMDLLLHKVKKAVTSASAINGTKVNLEIPAKMVAARPNRELEEIVSQVIVDVLGEKGLVTTKPTPGGEDFHFYSEAYPDLKATMIGLGTDLSPGLHHPNMSFELSSLFDGIKLLSLSICRLFEQR
ncbi:amidohydrolase [Anaerobacillus alkaliphilus]|uniref:Amidohydrolase n=1 Tax=Anaerobacillus alkaliphilus TaxID=1548597 RepID=A0A4Q0VL14_9BACI|nr:M20 peptidase aminoacylase family protein [Anaerobacillus alkaliphilus]RXI96181.1 amidohydrolase [Anaerobacillus alkaliphilus]